MVLTVQSDQLSDLFLIIADFYKYPDQEFYDQLISSKLLSELKEKMQKLELETSSINQDFDIPDFDQFKQEYSRCFIGLNEPSALPVESVYKVWTTDSQAQVNIANEKGYLMGDSALHIKHLMSGLGLEIPREYQQMPDHLTILLELLAYIIEHRQADEIKQFLDDHFDWLMDFKSRLVEIEALPLFLRITECLMDCIEQTKTIYKKL
ncbi:TorD/DmsD family molecular chaperone [Fuchsiella alkaliacetigena]|uniref:TorD/DmsD family molecular chaperone n=1 Tax=Fuchsiella alkaliacetigena TaxID=957042 RepID=UPI00200AE9AB|nr:molecular chaperone TorD family protein [Fuchsiella alkaliacetigena]MCK8825470.1 molecular chaperone TorD family protein [Fuchsiella alkaliacetigena]